MLYVRGVEEWIAIVVMDEEGRIWYIWKCFRKVNGQTGVEIVAEVVLRTAPAALEPENIGVLWASILWKRAIRNPNNTSLNFCFLGVDVIRFEVIENVMVQQLDL